MESTDTATTPEQANPVQTTVVDANDGVAPTAASLTEPSVAPTSSAPLMDANANTNANVRHRYDANDEDDEDDEDEEDEDEDEDEEDEDEDEDEEEEEEDEDEDEDDVPTYRATLMRGVYASSGKYSYTSSYVSRYQRPCFDLSGAPPGAGINYMFYAGKAPSMPDRDYIHQFHDRWWADYRRLEYEHGFIQWLFPVFESSGVNWDAEALSKSEAKLMREDFTIATRVIRSYRLMLNFYGIRLLSEETGEVARWPGIWRDRYDNLNWSGHNNLRITRILTSLGELGFKRYKQPLLDFLTKEILQNKQLPNCRSSLMSFWSKTVDYNSPAYKMKTKEDPEDREDSVFFTHMAQNTAEYQAWVAEEAKELAEREKGLEEAQKRDEEEEEEEARRQREKERERAEQAFFRPSPPSSSFSSPRYGSRIRKFDEESEGERAERNISEDDDDADVNFSDDNEDVEDFESDSVKEKDQRPDNVSDDSHDDDEDKGKGKL